MRPRSSTRRHARGRHALLGAVLVGVLVSSAPGCGDDPLTETRCVDDECLATCKENGSSCASRGECCSLSCHEGRCGEKQCSGEAGACERASDCCERLRCVTPNSPLPGALGICQAGCGLVDAECSEGDECCAGFTCQGRRFMPAACQKTCALSGESCTPVSDGGLPCCPGWSCQSGSCEPCRSMLCEAGGTPCCRGSCVDGRCDCAAYGESCATENDCCSSYPCSAGACGCARLGEACDSNDDCCNEEEQCIEGECRAEASP